MAELSADNGAVALRVAERWASRADKIYAMVAISLLILCGGSFFFLPLPTMQWFSDYWEHAAAIKALAQNMTSPLHPLYASYDPSRQFIPYNILLAVLVNYFDISVITALSILATAVVALLLLGIKLLADELFHHPWAPLVLLLTLLCAWGSPWVWTGFYELRAVFYNSYYPSAAVLSLTFIVWWCALRYLRARAVLSIKMVAIMGLVALMYITHQMAALFAVGGLMLFAMFESNVSLEKRLLLVFVVIVGVLVTWFWPYFNPIGLAGTAAVDDIAENFSAFYQPIPVILLIGPAFFAVPAIAGLIRQRKHLALVAGFFFIASAYLLFGFIEHPVGHRLIAYFMVYLHLILTWGVLKYIADVEVGVRTRSVSRYFVVVLMVMCVAAQVAFASLDFIRVAYETLGGRSFGNFPNQPVVENMRKIKEIIPDDAVVFSTPDESYPLPAFAGKLVNHPRAGWMIPDQESRTKDNKAFFSVETTNEQRLLLAEKYRATFVLLNRKNFDPGVLMALEKIGRSISIDNNIQLIDLRQQMSNPGGG